jgi:rhamnogalacturonyl hydrolase YesR
VQQNTVLSATSVYANPNSIYNTPENTKKYLMPNIWAWDGRWEYTFGVDHYDVNPDYENIDRDIYLNVATRFEGDLFNYRGPSNNIRTYINVYDIDRTTPMKNIFGGTKPWLAISGVTYRELYDRYNMRWNLTYYLNDNYLIFNRANNNDWGREISDVSIIYS